MTPSAAAADDKRQFNVLLPASLIREIKLASVDRECSLSSLVEQAMRDFLGKDTS